MRWCTPTAPSFDNPDLLACCVVGDGEAETGPLAASWHSNKFLNPARRRRCPADPSSERLQDRQPHRARADPARGAARAPRGLRPRAALRRGRRSGRDAQRSWPQRSTTSIDDIAAIQAAARDGRPARAAALADDRAAHAEGLDRTEGGRRPAGRGHVPLAPGPARRARGRTRSTSSSSRSGCAATGRRSCSTTHGALRRGARALRRRASGG